MTRRPRHKGMESAEASAKKIGGHLNEFDYAELIGGEVNKGSQTSKKDVVDVKHGTHSVKSGKKWQIFLYGRSRFESDTVLKGIGDVSSLLINCIESLPPTREEREANPEESKLRLQAPMRALASELEKPKILAAFLHKAAFEGGEVNYWAILPPTVDQTRAELDQKAFHVFHADDVITTIVNNIQVVNSKARNRTQRDDQKVVFRSGKNLGEIEIRTDPTNYRRAKMWFMAAEVLNLLRFNVEFAGNPHPQIYVYGQAKNLVIP